MKATVLKRTILISLFGFAFCLRISALFYGIPQDVFGEELVQVLAAFSLLEQRTLNASFSFYYLPPLMSYILAPLFGITGVVGIALGWFDGMSGFREFVLLNRDSFLPILRCVSVSFSLGGLWVAYVFARRLFNERIAIGALALSVGNFWLVHESQVGHFWVPALFFMLAACWGIWRVYEGGERKWYVWSAALVAAGFAMGYWPLMLVPWFITAHVYGQRERKRPLVDKNIILSTSLLFLLLAVFSIANTVAFMRQFGRAIAVVFRYFGVRIESAAWPDPGIFPVASWQTLGEAVVFNSPLVFVAAVFGFVFLWIKQGLSLRWLLIAGFPVSYYLVSSLIHSGADYHYIVPMLPFLDMAAALFCYGVVFEWQGWRSARQRSIAYALSILVIASLSYYVSIGYSIMLQQADTRIQAIQWIYRNVPDGAGILIEMNNVEINKSEAVLVFMRDHIPSAMNSRDRFLISQEGDKVPKPNYFVLQAGDLIAAHVDHEDIDFDYYVFEYYDEVDYGIRSVFFPGSELVAAFYPSAARRDIGNILKEPRNPFVAVRSVERGGPYVEIHRIGP